MWTRFLQWLMTRMGRDSRGLFLFYDGRRWRTADGLESLRAFFTRDGFDWDETPEQLKIPTATTQVLATKRIADAVRGVFGIKRAAEGGLSEAECLNLFWRFRGYLDDVKKNGSLYPILPDATESNQLEAWEIPARPGSASGSTVPAPSNAPPGLPAEPTGGG